MRVRETEGEMDRDRRIVGAEMRVEETGKGRERGRGIRDRNGERFNHQ